MNKQPDSEGDDMNDIILGVLANGLYDIIKRGAGRFRASTKLSDRIREIQWERLYADADLQKQIDRYRSQRSKVALVGLGNAVQKMLQSEPELAAGMQELLSDEMVLREVVSLADAENPSQNEPVAGGNRTQLSQTERLALVQQLNGLPAQPFNMLLLALNPPAGQVPPPTAAQGDRVFALLNWVEGTGGCGLDAVREILEAIVNPS
jgi:hypothetical protein